MESHGSFVGQQLCLTTVRLDLVAPAVILVLEKQRQENHSRWFFGGQGY